MGKSLSRVARGLLSLAFVGLFVSGCGFNGASVTDRPDLARNAKPVDATGDAPVVGNQPPVVFPPAPPPRPEQRDPEAVFESQKAGEYTVRAEVHQVSPTGVSRRKLSVTFDVNTFEDHQVNRTKRVFEDQTGYLTGFATVRGSAVAGFEPARFVVRLEKDAQGAETLYFSEASARRLMRALLPAEFERGELDLRSEKGLVLARFGDGSLAVEPSLLAGAVVFPVAMSVVGGPLVPLMGMPAIFASEYRGVCNPSRAGAIRMLSRDLLWKSASSPNLLEHPNCR